MTKRKPDNVVADSTPCGWAPLIHTVPAAGVVEVGRPCGHETSLIPTCAEHLDEYVEGHVTPIATVCRVCLVESMRQIKAHRTLEEPSS